MSSFLDKTFTVRQVWLQAPRKLTLGRTQGHMPNAFNFATPPFDCLNQDEQRLVRGSVDVVYFREGEVM